MSDPVQTALQHQRAGRLAEAAEIYQTLLRADPQQPGLLHQYGLLHYQAGHPAEGLKYLQRALALRPDPACWCNAALMHMALGQAAQAIQAAEQALRLQPDHADAANNLALALGMLGRLDEAETACRRALALRPDFAEARFNLANILKDRGAYAVAQAEYRALLQQRPDYVAAQVNLGVVCELAGDLEAALAAYRAAATLRPDLTMAHLNAGLALHKLHRFREAIATLREALKRDDTLVAAHMAIGQSARELNDSATALAALRRAAELAPEDAQVKAALSGLLSAQIPGWHFPMLADTARNEAFAAALDKAVQPGLTVLDIGTGSGLLAMLAARAGAERVIACEAYPLIAETAQEIVAKNGYADRIAVIAKRSTELEPGRDLPKPADLVVAEVLDAGLTGEGMLPTIRDALRRLARPGATVIPAAAQVVAQVVRLPNLRAVNPLREICGFDLSPFDKFRNQSAHGVVRLDHEPYEALSAVLPVCRVDFANPPDWVQPQQMAWSAPILRDGTAQALVFWFELWLDAEIMLSTGPDGAMRHWGQAVCWLPEDRPVQAGGQMAFRVTLADTYFDFAPA
ncbi:tetratricopeptide repeat protein [Ferrovibrio sp.]|uniref:tetratricopeptide repeat protein n=1 Tax=Ferrovibrio sp. TaxID=1917215 RepID=UPI0026312A83|nr:tetratricopeptide repeat protein [Ferrovibrio sp.]